MKGGSSEKLDVLAVYSGKDEYCEEVSQELIMVCVAL